MKKNIFAEATPNVILLPFATIRFLPEPYKRDVKSIDDLPTAALKYMDTATAEVHQFYLQIVRKPTDQQYDFTRADALIRDRVNEAIQAFGQGYMGQTDLEPHYPSHCYRHSLGSEKKLNDDADETFFSEVVQQARPLDEMYSRLSIYELGFSGKDHIFNLKLTDTLKFYAWTTDERTIGHYLATGPSNITGTAKFMGKPAKIRVSIDRRYSLGEDFPISEWLTQDVLRNDVEMRLSDVLGESFSVLGSDVVKHLISDIAFDLN